MFDRSRKFNFLNVIKWKDHSSDEFDQEFIKAFENDFQERSFEVNALSNVVTNVDDEKNLISDNVLKTVFEKEFRNDSSSIASKSSHNDHELEKDNYQHQIIDIENNDSIDQKYWRNIINDDNNMRFVNYDAVSDANDESSSQEKKSIHLENNNLFLIND